MQPRLLVVGSIALDCLQGGRVRDELGGSALYTALSAAALAPVTMIAPVGPDADAVVRSILRLRPAIDASRLDVLDAPTYRWFADVDEAALRNIDLGSHDAIYDRWSPRIPGGYRGWAFVGSMRPDRQLEAARALAGCGLLAADAMRSYVVEAPQAAREVLRLVDWYYCNEEEYAALGGGDPEEFRRAWELDGLVLKRGPHGASVYTAEGRTHAPALPGIRVVDTTGAGDALAGGMLAWWMRRGGRRSDLPGALRAGIERASLAISDIGLRALLAGG